MRLGYALYLKYHLQQGEAVVNFIPFKADPLYPFLFYKQLSPNAQNPAHTILD